MSFAGNTAVVTGAAGGMGRAIAGALLSAGANVVAIDARPIEDMTGDGELLSLTGSVADWPFISNAFEQAAKSFERVDYLVNAAGVLWFDRDKSLSEIDLDTWDDVMAINLKGCVHTSRAAIPLMKPSGGAMVHFSSIQALRGDDAPQDAYQASKAALIAMSKSIAVQFAGSGIRSNCILPGPTESPMQDRWKVNPDQLEATQHAVPLGRVGTVEDMSNACLFLLSDKAGYITGTELIVDGGLTALP